MQHSNPSRVAVFIDNSNIYKRISELKKVNKQWVCLYDPLKLAQKLTGNRQLVSINFYCAPPPAHMTATIEGKRRYSVQMKYYAEIQKLPGVEVKFATLQGTGQTLKEKNLDTQLTANMLKMAAQNQFDTAILVSNDADYISAIEPVKNDFGKKVEILYFKGHISTSLWQLADVPRKAKQSHFVPLFIPPSI